MIRFQDIDLNKPLLRALEHAGYEHATEIQAEAIPKALQGFDILGGAQTGTGKTAAFVLPMLHHLAYRRRKPLSGKPFALILAPTRELASQIRKSIDTYGRNLKLKSCVIYGGVSQFNQVRSLQRGCEIVVATPGRLIDLMDQGHIDLSALETFVLDEADRMLDMGFMPDLKRIIGCLPAERQSMFFSATLAPEIVRFAHDLLHEPVVINIAPKETKTGKIDEHMVLVKPDQKYDRLKDVLIGEDVKLTLVFTRTKRGANKIEGKLKDDGFRAAAIHGDKTQANRQRSLAAFRNGRVQVLVATDVAARGIDVSDVSHVINYDIPTEPESYVHRIGRTGRAGADGIAITFYTSDQRQELRAIERFKAKDDDQEFSETLRPSKPRGGGKPQGRGFRKGPGKGAGKASGKGPRKSFGKPHAKGKPNGRGKAKAHDATRDSDGVRTGNSTRTNSDAGPTGTEPTRRVKSATGRKPKPKRGAKSGAAPHANGAKRKSRPQNGGKPGQRKFKKKATAKRS